MRQQPLTAEKPFYLLACTHFERLKEQEEDFQRSHLHSFQFTSGLFRMRSDQAEITMEGVISFLKELDPASMTYGSTTTGKSLP